MKLSDVVDLRTAVGLRVKALRAFSGVLEGTKGVVDEYYGAPGTHEGVMVAWSPFWRPLPAGYRAYDGVPIVTSGILRDGFGRGPFDETQWLEIVEGDHDGKTGAAEVR